MCENSGAVRQNIVTKDSMKKLVVDELAVWFGNAMDRSTGVHRLLKLAQFKETESESITTDQELTNTADDIVDKKFNDIAEQTDYFYFINLMCHLTLLLIIVFSVVSITLHVIQS